MSALPALYSIMITVSSPVASVTSVTSADSAAAAAAVATDEATWATIDVGGSAAADPPTTDDDRNGNYSLVRPT